MDPKFYDVGPGWPAFVATFALAVAVILLSRSLNRHLRKLRLEAAARDQTKPVVASPQSLDGLSVEDRDGRGNVVADEAGDGQ